MNQLNTILTAAVKGMGNLRIQRRFLYPLLFIISMISHEFLLSKLSKQLKKRSEHSKNEYVEKIT